MHVYCMRAHCIILYHYKLHIHLNAHYIINYNIHNTNKISGKRFVVTTTGGAFTSNSYLMSRPGI